MSRSNTLRKEAPALLRAVKAAFKFIRDNPVGDESERKALLKKLHQVIDRADPATFDEDMLKVKLTMTKPTADAIIKTLRKRAIDSDIDQQVLERVLAGERRTKQRVYVSLDIEYEMLRHLRYVLMHTKTDHQDRSFKRLADDIEREVREKNPMEIIGRMAL